MLRSLVGSEMCIRDSRIPRASDPIELGRRCGQYLHRLLAWSRRRRRTYRWRSARKSLACLRAAGCEDRRRRYHRTNDFSHERRGAMHTCRPFILLMALRTASNPLGQAGHTDSSDYRMPSNKIRAYIATNDAIHYGTMRCSMIHCDRTITGEPV